MGEGQGLRVGVWAVVLLLTVLIGFSFYNRYVPNNQCKAQIVFVNQTVESSPSTSSVGVQSFNVANNIQAPHVVFNFSCGNQGLTISDVDCATVSGNSMQPTLFTGNTLIWIPYNQGDQLREGWIIKYDTPTGVTSHRIKAVYPGYVIVQGDNNFGADAVQKTDILAVSLGVLWT